MTGVTVTVLFARLDITDATKLDWFIDIAQRYIMLFCKQPQDMVHITSHIILLGGNNLNTSSFRRHTAPARVRCIR